MRPGPAVTAAAPDAVIERPEPDTPLQLLARLAFVEADPPPLRLETLHDLTERAPNTAWTEGTIVESEDDPAPEALTDWANSTQVKLAVVVPPAQVAASTSPLPIVKVALPRAESLNFVTRRNGALAARLAEISPAASNRLAEKFRAAGFLWPPVDATFLAIKDTRTLELFARGSGGGWTFIHRYRVMAASGRAGPKLHKGDNQVPEGVYRISYLNPNSRYHVSLRVNYPNDFDRLMAAKDRRTDLGGDIMIHGKSVSAGCLAVGDDAAEELFVLADTIGLEHLSVVITPTDFRSVGLPVPQIGDPAWLPQLYAQLAEEMTSYKSPPSSGIAGGLLSFFGR